MTQGVGLCLEGLVEQPSSSGRTKFLVLPESVLLPRRQRQPWTLSEDEQREAYRALKGSVLRQEVYADDGTERADRPYTTSERSYTLELLQPRSAGFPRPATATPASFR